MSMVNELLLYENEKERSGRTMKIWQAALYVRLSREDGDKAESDSIGNENSVERDKKASERIIRLYCQKHEES